MLCQPSARYESSKKTAEPGLVVTDKHKEGSSQSAISTNAVESAVGATTAPTPRDFGYVNLPVEERYQNRVVMIVFAGRKSRLQSQILYLERLVNTTEIDFVHYHECNPSPSDKAYLHSLAERMPPWFALCDCSGGFSSVYAHYENETLYETTNFIKIDDDIVFLPTNNKAITKAVQYNQQHPEASWTSGLVVNNPLVDHLLQQQGVIPQTEALNFTALPIDGTWVGIPSIADYAQRKQSLSALHDYFIAHVDQFENLPYPPHIFNHTYRVCLNAMFFRQHQLKRWNLSKGGFDEIVVRWYNLRNNMHVHLFLQAPMVHLNYGRQRTAGLVDNRFEKEYLALACRRLELTKERDECREFDVEEG